METAVETLERRPQSKMLIRFSECDLFGHLNNVWYVKYFLDAREDHIANEYGLSLAHFVKKGLGWVVGSNQIRYFRPARVNEQVIIRTSLLNFADDRLLVEMQMWDEATSHLKAAMWTSFVHVSVNDGRKAPHSEDLMDLFKRVHLPVANAADFQQRMDEIRSLPFNQ